MKNRGSCWAGARLSRTHATFELGGVRHAKALFSRLCRCTRALAYSRPSSRLHAGINAWLRSPCSMQHGRKAAGSMQVAGTRGPAADWARYAGGMGTLWSGCECCFANGRTAPGVSPVLQNGLDKKIEKSRKQKKERRNRARKVRGAKKNSCK